jgi:hypothetical protein
MPELVLKPTWPSSSFRRTVVVKRDKAKKPSEYKTFVFSKSEPVTVTGFEFELLKADVGNSLFEIERDEKGRIRHLDPEREPVPTQRQETAAASD